MPVFFNKSGNQEAIRDLLNDLSTGETPSSSGIIHDFSSLVACHSAIKAGDELTESEMNALFDQLFATKNPFTCPHGRPTIIKLTLSELFHRFGRS